MSELFIKTSKVLRDNLVTELQTDVNFLRNHIISKKDKLYGKKVKILEHEEGMENRIIPSGNGIFLGIYKTHNYCKVLRINEDDDSGKICLFRLENIVFENISQIFS